MYCHHIILQSTGGTDEYSNLIFVTDIVHKLIHATNENTIFSLMRILNLEPNQIAKLNKYHILAGLNEIA